MCVPAASLLHATPRAVSRAGSTLLCCCCCYCFVPPPRSGLSCIKVPPPPPPGALTLNALNLLIGKRKKGRWGVVGGEIAPAQTATLILCTQDLCLLQSFAASVSSPLRPRRPGSRCAGERARSLALVHNVRIPPYEREPGTSKHASKLPKSFTEKHKAKS